MIQARGSLRGLRGWGRDLRAAVRALRRAPLLTAAALATLALGIGANTAVFSAAYAVAWRPLPYPQGGQLVNLQRIMQGKDGWAIAAADFDALIQRSHTFAALALYRFDGVPVRRSGEAAKQVLALLATPELFAALKLPPEAGRYFASGEMVPGARVALLGDAFAIHEFGSAARAVGRELLVDGKAVRIVGVLPPRFSDFLGPGAVKLVLPLPPTPPADRKAGMYSLVGRIAPGSHIAAVRADLAGVAVQLRAAGVFGPGDGFSVESLAQAEHSHTGPSPFLLVGAGGLLLLLACVNVASLLLARIAARRQEIAVRMALGASRVGIARGIWMESTMLALLGGGLGIWLSWLMIEAVPRLDPPYWLRVTEGAGLGAAGLVFAFAAAIVAGAFLSLAPMALALAPGTAALLERPGTLPPPASPRLRGGLIAGEIALALVLAAGAGLLIQTVARLAGTPVGFDPNHADLFAFQIPSARYGSTSQKDSFYFRLLERVRALPGVTAAGLTNSPPFEGSMNFIADAPGRAALPMQLELVSPDYFRAAGMRLLRGRGLEAGDRTGAPQTAVISETMARQLWPDGDALGQRFSIRYKPDTRPWTVVGIVADIHQFGYQDRPQPQAFLPLAQLPWPGLSLMVRTAGDPAFMSRPIEQQAAALDPAAAAMTAEPMAAVLRTSIRQQRFLRAVLTLAAALALLLAAIGTYGGVSYWVSERTNEIGVRMALGASPRRVAGMVLSRALTWAGAGAVAGVAGALAADRELRTLLYGIAPGDPITLALAAALLLAAAALAAYPAARRAAAADPAVVLRRG